MKQLFCVALALATLAAAPGSTRAEVITFDDVPVAGWPGIPDGYKNLQWDNFSTTEAIHQSGFENGIVSPPYVAFAAFGFPASFGADAPFAFNQAILTAAHNDGLQIQVDGFLGGVRVYNQTVTVDTSGPTVFNFDYLGVDKVLFTPFGGAHHDGYSGVGTHFIMDNLVVSSVPEPAGLTLLGLGAIGVGLAAARRRWARR